jgi:hypothetical protein
VTRARDVADTQDNVGGAVPPFVSGKNMVINGGFDLWARGTSFTAGASAAYTADRWQAFQGTATAITYSRQATNDITNLPNIQYCTRIQRTNGSTSTSQSNFAQSFETANSIPYAGKTLTFSFYGRVGANYSHSGGTINLLFGTGTGTDQNWFSGFTGIAYQFAGWTGTSTWQRFTATVTIPTTATQIGFSFYFTPVGTAGANDWFEVTGVQLEVGSVATPFARAGGSIGGELALCQRYYYVVAQGATDLTICNGYAIATTQCEGVVSYPQMRTAPALVASTGTSYYKFRKSGGDYPVNSLSFALATPVSGLLFNSTQFSGTAGVGGSIVTNNSAASIALSAEL